MKKEAKLFQGLTRFLQATSNEAPLADPAAFSAFYDKTHLPLYRYVFGLSGGTPEDSEDLTAETFTRAWKARHTFQGSPQAAVGWLFRIARSLVIDTYRRGQARGPLAEMSLEEIPQAAPTPEDLLLADEQQRQLWELVQRLPSAQREMVVLRYLLDWRVSQIGAYLEIPENTVSVTLRRALARLQGEWPQGKE